MSSPEKRRPRLVTESGESVDGNRRTHSKNKTRVNSLLVFLALSDWDGTRAAERQAAYIESVRRRRAPKKKPARINERYTPLWYSDITGNTAVAWVMQEHRERKAVAA